MTIPANAKIVSEQLPSDREVEAANHLRRIIAAQAEGNATLDLLDGDEKVSVTLTPSLSALLLELLRYIGDGSAVTLVPIHQMLTTQQTADILNVSRPHLIKLLEGGEIPYQSVGRHRRVLARDVLAFKATRDASRREALNDLMGHDSQLV